ncbi:hypothetical protein QVD17_06210 [Tagetes erecta]|uniref:Uncharacterized protein n=1 Tax=Tagetes erecta TaxID=13708 RepID=A0AAD8P662_TARER|nr:hypothetical protein QVD17_06210 [Tagetes erecta]
MHARENCLKSLSPNHEHKRKKSRNKFPKSYSQIGDFDLLLHLSLQINSHNMYTQTIPNTQTNFISMHTIHNQTFNFLYPVL